MFFLHSPLKLRLLAGETPRQVYISGEDEGSYQCLGVCVYVCVCLCVCVCVLVACGAFMKMKVELGYINNFRTPSIGWFAGTVPQ